MELNWIEWFFVFISLGCLVLICGICHAYRDSAFIKFFCCLLTKMYQVSQSPRNPDEISLD